MRSSIVTGDAKEVAGDTVSMSYCRVGAGQDFCADHCITSDPQLDAQFLPALASPVIDAGAAHATTKDLLGKTRAVDQAAVSNTGTGSPAYTDMGAIERQ